MKRPGAHHILLFLVFSFIVSATVSAQKISGKVFNEGGRPASYVTVQFNKLNSVFTNEDGTFVITAKKLPDTLFFFAAGFEPYKVLVTELTSRDPHFEVVLLNTRRKIKTSDVSTNLVQGKNLPNSNGNGQANSTPGAGSYISGKKLFMIDTINANRSVMYRSGLLTAGEVNDFNKATLWSDFTSTEFRTQSDHWHLYPLKRYSVQVENKNHSCAVGQTVYLIDAQTKDTVWSAVTDNTGKAELWASMKDSTGPSEYNISCNGEEIHSASLFGDAINKIELMNPCFVPGEVDISVVVDATGSMTSEIDFLKIELEDVLRNTFAEYHDLDLRVGAVFYRDKGDEYLTRHVDLQTDLLKVLNFIKLQRASGGGDVPEAVHLALQTALDSLHWNSQARTRILFLVTDAPPHDETKEKIFQLIKEAAAKGVRIVPVICRGADKSTEFIMRSMALATNGTYVFLTDDGSADFITGKRSTGIFDVQFLNTMLERIIRQMVFAGGCAVPETAELPKNIPGNIGAVKLSFDSQQRTITVDSKLPVKEIFLADFTGKILARLQNKEKQIKWTTDLQNYPNGTFLVKYITQDDQWGSEKFELNRQNE